MRIPKRRNDAPMTTNEAAHSEGPARFGFVGEPWWALFATLLTTLAYSATAWGGSYLNRATLLVQQSSQEADYVRPRVTDRELAQMVHRIAEARLAAAGRMVVPKEVALAHPHLLLTLENYERAMDAAMDGETARFLVYVRRAREEEAVLRSVLQRLGWPLPRGHLP